VTCEILDSVVEWTVKTLTYCDIVPWLKSQWERVLHGSILGHWPLSIIFGL
jgi:hypothetical protein